MADSALSRTASKTLANKPAAAPAARPAELQDAASKRLLTLSTKLTTAAAAAPAAVVAAPVAATAALPASSPSTSPRRAVATALTVLAADTIRSEDGEPPPPDDDDANANANANANKDDDTGASVGADESKIKAFDQQVSLRVAAGGADDDDAAVVDHVAVEWDDTGATSTLRGAASAPNDDSAPSSPRAASSATTPRAAASASPPSSPRPTAAAGAGAHQKPAAPAPAKKAAVLLPPKEVSKSERDFAAKLLEQSGDSVVHMQWVTKQNAAGDAQARLIVLGLYRVYSVKRRWNGRKEVRRDGHYLDLSEVFTDSPDHVKLCFARPAMKDPFVIDIFGQGAGVSLPQKIAFALRTWAFDLPQEKLPAARVERALVPNERVEFAAPAAPAGSMGGFVAMYKAMCNYYAMPVQPQVTKFIEALGAKRTSMWLNRCSKIRHPNLVALRPIVAALKHNRHFLSVMLTRVERPTALSAFAVAVQSSTVLRRLIISGCGVRADGALLLGRALADQKRSVLSHIDIAHNAIGDRGLLGLIDGLRTLRHSLTTLRVAKCELTHKSLAPLFFAFTDVGAGVLTSAMGELDVSENAGGPIATNAIINWLRVGALPDAGGGAAVAEAPLEADGAAKRLAPVVRKLELSACRLELARLFTALRRAPLLATLEKLHCGGSKFTGEASAALGRLVAAAPALRVIDVNACQIDAGMLADLAAGVVENRAVGAGAVELDVSSNGFGAAGCLQLLSALNKTNHVGSLNLRRNKIGVEGHIALFDFLASPDCTVLRSLEELMLTFEDVRKPGAHPRVDEMLSKLVACLQTKKCALHKLVVYGSADKYVLGRQLAPLIKAVATVPVTYLDISGQMLEDKGAPAVADLIRASSHLQTLVVDANAFTAAGFQLIREALATNYTICNMPYPRHDAHRAIAAGKQQAKALNDELMAIKALLKRNRLREENIKVTWVNDDDEDDDDDDDDDDSGDGDDGGSGANADEAVVNGSATLRGRAKIDAEL
jgi:hypothetical protein